MDTTLARPYTSTRSERRTLYRVAEGSLWLGIAAAIFLTVIWLTSTQTEYPQPFQHTSDYLFTGNGIPFGLAPLALVWSLRGLHGDQGGRKVPIGVALTSISLAFLIVILGASVAAGQELRWGPGYPLATLGSIIGIALCCAGWARAGLVPRAALWFWAFGWTVGGMLGPKGSQLILAAGYALLLVQLRKSRREDPLT